MTKIVPMTSTKFSPHPSKKGNNVWGVIYKGESYTFKKLLKDKDPHTFDPDPTPEIKKDIIAAFHQKAINAKRTAKHR